MSKVTINGKPFPIPKEDADMPLLWFLRDQVGLKGTKFGCGRGLCGACTVHLGKTAIRSCSVPVEAVKNQEVTTIEGLGKSGLHPLQKSWIKHNVPQCGYCQPGQLMGAAALLHQNPKANDQQIETGMEGHICRCGTYPRIKKAIKDVVSGDKK